MTLIVMSYKKHHVLMPNMSLESISMHAISPSHFDPRCHTFCNFSHCFSVYASRMCNKLDLVNVPSLMVRDHWRHPSRQVIFHIHLSVLCHIFVLSPKEWLMLKRVNLDKELKNATSSVCTLLSKIFLKFFFVK